MDRSNFSQRLDKMVLYWNGRAHESVSVCMSSLFISDVLLGKQLTAVLKGYSLGLTVPGYVPFSNPLNGLLDFVTGRLLLSQMLSEMQYLSVLENRTIYSLLSYNVM